MADRVHVLCALELDAAQIERLQRISDRVIVEAHAFADSSALEAAFRPETQVLFGWRPDFDPRVAPGLHWLQVLSAGVDSVQKLPIWQTAVTITSANGVHAIQIGEYVLMTMLAHMHRLPAMQRLQWQKSWAGQDQRPQLMPDELRGATLGIVGYGAIGREVARLATSFGMRILATQRTPEPRPFDGWTPAGTGDPDGSLPERYYVPAELPDFLAACDVVVLSVPLTAETHHMIDAAALRSMRPHALLVNIGRGGLLDQEALVAALEAQAIGGVALDVTDPEPLPPTSRLWELPNAMITPHISGMTRDYERRVVDLFAENLRRYLNGEPLLNVVDRQRGY